MFYFVLTTILIIVYEGSPLCTNVPGNLYEATPRVGYIRTISIFRKIDYSALILREIKHELHYY